MIAWFRPDSRLADSRLVDLRLADHPALTEAAAGRRAPAAFARREAGSGATIGTSA